MVGILVAVGMAAGVFGLGLLVGMAVGIFMLRRPDLISRLYNGR
jgi:hypothetical protein